MTQEPIPKVEQAARTAASVAFVDNPAVLRQPERYRVMTIDIPKTLDSWRRSLYACEYLTPEGLPRPRDELPAQEQARFDAAFHALKQGAALERPVLGIGMLDNVEIGTGRAVFLALASRGDRAMEAHIPRSQEKDFLPFVSV
ncbi:MAG: hypothetical protein KDJ15_05695 [Alphaproteobacteria bacterium]|nr:hypothetical protein [Alphaproteobacteria bacterium]